MNTDRQRKKVKFVSHREGWRQREIERQEAREHQIQRSRVTEVQRV